MCAGTQYCEDQRRGRRAAAGVAEGPNRPEDLGPFGSGWGELWGIADRTDYDLGRHQEASGKNLEYYDQERNEHYIPYVIEPSLGCDRVALAFLCEAYDEEVVGTDKKGNPDIRTVLHLHPALAPFKAAVLPLSKKLSPKAEEIYHELQKYFMVDFDDAGSIGKRFFLASLNEILFFIHCSCIPYFIERAKNPLSYLDKWECDMVTRVFLNIIDCTKGES